MTAAISDLIMQVGNRGTKTTIEAPGKGTSATSITLNNPAGWVTDTAIIFSLYIEDPTTKAEVEGSYTVWKGVVNGDQVEQLELKFGTNQAYPAGAIAIMHISAPWANSLVDAMLVSHNQDGTVKNDAVSTTAIVNKAVTPAKMSDDANVETRMAETMANSVASGLVWSAAAGLNGSMTAGVAYVLGKRLVVPAVTSYTFTASKDTYIYVDDTGTMQYTPVNNGATAPATPSNYVTVAKVITNGTSITSTTAMPGKPYTSDKLDLMTRIRLAKASISTNFSTTSSQASPTAVPGLSVTFTLDEPATVRACVTASSIYNNTADSYNVVFISNGGMSTANAFCSGAYSLQKVNQEMGLTLEGEIDLPAGIHTLNFGMGRNIGTMTLTASPRPAIFVVDRVG